MPLLTTSHGVDIAYQTTGSVNDPPVMLVHGLGAQLIGWHPDLVRKLADAGHRVIRFDNRDVGLSAKFPDTSYTLDDMTDDLMSVLDAFCLESAHIIGQSLGGMIAQLAALDHPERVRSLGLIYTTPSTRNLVGLHALEDRNHQPVARDRDAAVAQFVANEAVSSSPLYATAEQQQWIEELGAAMYDRCYDPAGINRQFDAMLRAPDRDARLGGISVPTTIIHGGSDRVISPTGGRELHAAIPGSILVELPGVGHELPRPLWDRIVGVLSRTITQGEKVLRA